jgi:outer membrane protein assembly factor BamB
VIRERFVPLTRVNRSLFAIINVAFVVLGLSGCSSVEKPKPAELGPNIALLGVRPAWTARVGPVGMALSVNVTGQAVTLASADGTVAAIDARTGQDLWRANLATPLAAGVGSDGKVAAVVTRGNQLVALGNGKEIWRQKLPAQGFTAPLVAGNRVFVLLADRSVHAFDGESGRRLWSQARPGDALVLRQAGTLVAVGDTLVVGLSGRLVGMNPLNGTSRWEAPVATPRGTNEVERLVDLVGSVSRVGDVVCTRAFQTAVGCVNTGRGTVLWTKPAVGSQGVDGDDRAVFGTESDGQVIAWRRTNGERLWATDRLKYRALSAPLVLGRSLVVGDGTGVLHLLSREDGSPLNRLNTDGSAVVAAPVVAGGTLVVVTGSGGVHGFRPE